MPDKNIRVLIVDDSVVIRRLLCDTLSQEPGLEVIGSASDGRIALAKVSQLRPDLVTLDVEMPVLNGMETLAELRKLHPSLPVIMFSTLTEHGAGATLDALALGASDYATKPSNFGNPVQAIERIRSELIPKIKALCRKFALAPLSPPAFPNAGSRRSPAPVEIVAIGTSTGGPNALAEVMPRIPRTFPVPIVLVQHMPPIFTRLLAERLSKQSEVAIEEGSEGASLTPGRAWIAPGNFHMRVVRKGLRVVLSLNQEPPENSCRPAVDVLFRSVADVFGPNALAVVMTGMGSDGVLGSQEIRRRGGQVVVQDEATSVVWGMPGLVQASGAAEAAYPLSSLAGEITGRVLQSRNVQSRPHNSRELTAKVGK